MGGWPVRRMCKYLVVVGSLCSSRLQSDASGLKYARVRYWEYALPYHHHVRDGHTISWQVHVIYFM